MKRLILTACMMVLLLPALCAAAQLSPQRQAEIRETVMNYLKQKHANQPVEIRLKRMVVSNEYNLPAGKLDYDLIAPQQWGGWGGATIAVIARRADRVVGNFSVRVDVEVLAEMLFAVRQIGYGHVLTAGDLVLRKHDIAAIQGRYLSRIEDAVGKKARMTLRANVPVRSDQIQTVPIIKAGQMVTIVAENERMRITVTGKARGAGAVGDTIIVQNLSSLKQFPARIVNAETVRIVY